MTQGIDADLGLQERKRRSQSLPIRVRTVSVGRQAQNRAEKSHPTKIQCLRWNQVPLWDRNVSLSFLRYDAASGNWQPIITRRVMRAPNASESRKESVASSHTSPFYKIFGFDNRLLKVRDSVTIRGLFLCLDFCATLSLRARQRRLLCQRARPLQLLRHQMNRPQGLIEGRHFESKDRATGS